MNNQWQGHLLKKVWNTPKVAKHLFSVSSAAAKGLEYWLDKKNCKLIYDGKKILVSEQSRGLYNLIIHVVLLDSSVEVFIAKTVESLQTWYDHLEHQNKHYIEK